MNPKRRRAFSLFEMLIVMVLLGTLMGVVSTKGFSYWRLYREARAKEEHSLIFSLLSEYAKLESTPFVVDFIQKNGQTYVDLENIEGLKPGFFRGKKFVIAAKIKEKKVLFAKDGKPKILEEHPS
jgi:prepilin-type N-terminal cleavage/methylation domain-containing protein